MHIMSNQKKKRNLRNPIKRYQEKKQHEEFLASQEKLKKTKQKKNKLEYKRSIDEFTEKITQSIRNKIFEAIGSDKQQVSEDGIQLVPQKSKCDLVRELKKIPIFNDFINQGGSNPEDFLNYLNAESTKGERKPRKKIEK